MHVLGSFIFGLPSDRPETFDAALSVAERSDLTFAQFVMLTPFPGTLDFAAWEKSLGDAPERVDGIPVTRHWLIPQANRPEGLHRASGDEPDEIRDANAGGVGSVLHVPQHLVAVAGVVKSLKARLAFLLISKIYRQMYANTGIATDSARVNRSAQWARWMADPVPPAVCRPADAEPATPRIARAGPYVASRSLADRLSRCTWSSPVTACILHFDLPPPSAAAGAFRAAGRNRMRIWSCHGLVICAASLLASPIAIHAAAQQSPAPKTGRNAPITMTGCVSTAPGVNGAFTFQQAEGGKYRLSGKGMRKFAGQKVELIGGGPRGFTIRGGLWPSPNIAAQAGALDPAQVAIASQPGGTATAGTGADLPEFRVNSVRALEGGCR